MLPSPTANSSFKITARRPASMRTRCWALPPVRANPKPSSRSSRRSTVLGATSREGESKTVDRLELLLVVHVDGGIPVGPSGESQPRLLPLEQGGLIRVGQPDLRLAAN